MSKRNSKTRQARRAFDPAALKKVCEMHELEFSYAYDLDIVDTPSSSWARDEDYYYFQDNGADILYVAHLDTVVDHHQRECRFIDTSAGKVVNSGALDDRLGAYVGLEMMPALGINHDILLTVGEESGASTAEHFEAVKQYNWIIEFDRGGTDVVLYEYENDDMVNLVKSVGARVGIGAFSDISYMEHVGVKALNWGVGYRDYHSVRGHAYLEDTFMMVGHYLRFHENYADLMMPHTKRPTYRWDRSGYVWDDAGWASMNDPYRCLSCYEMVDPTEEVEHDCEAYWARQDAEWEAERAEHAAWDEQRRIETHSRALELWTPERDRLWSPEVSGL